MGAAGTAAELQATHRRHRWRTGSRRSYRLHSGGSGGGLETSRGGAGGGTGAGGHRGSPQPEAWTGGSDSESRSLRTAGLGQPAGPRHSPAPTGVRRGTSDGHGFDRVEGGGDNGKPGRAGRPPRLAVTGVLVSAVGALVITPRDIISHRFALSLFKGSSRDQRDQSPIVTARPISDCYNGRLHDYTRYTNRIPVASYVWGQTHSAHDSTAQSSAPRGPKKRGGSG